MSFCKAACPEKEENALSVYGKGLNVHNLKLFRWNEFSASSAPATIGQFFMGGVQLAILGFLGEYVMAINARTMKRPLVVEEERINFPTAPKHAEEMGAEERAAYVRLVYQARRVVLSGGKVPEIMAATGLSREEAEEILREENCVQ